MRYYEFLKGEYYSIEVLNFLYFLIIEGFESYSKKNCRRLQHYSKFEFLPCCPSTPKICLRKSSILTVYRTSQIGGQGADKQIFQIEEIPRELADHIVPKSMKKSS